jgi:hypothetical protein
VEVFEMRITNIGTDYIAIDEDNINDNDLLSIPRVHLIKLEFFKPTEGKIRAVLDSYPKTNRYVIENNIKTYNYILKGTSKKYYVENPVGAKVITFFKKNNKVLVNFNNMTSFEQQFLLSDDCFEDVLRNTEVIMINQSTFEEKKSELERWSGNVIIHNGSALL